MGNEQSIEPKKAADNVVHVFDPQRKNMPMWGLYDPMVYSELPVEVLYPAPPVSESQRCVHSPEVLMNLLGCPDQVKDVDAVLSAMIAASSKEMPDLKKLEEVFRTLKAIGGSRLGAWSLHRQWAKWVNTKYDVTYGITNQNIASYRANPAWNASSFFNILIEWSENILPKKKAPEEIFEFIMHAKPCTGVLPPLNQFYANQPGLRQTFHASSVLERGLACNGQYLVALCGNGDLQIFSLMEGVLHQPMVVHLQLPNIDPGAYLFFRNEYLVLEQHSFHYLYTMESLVRGNNWWIRQDLISDRMTCGNCLSEVFVGQFDYVRSGSLGRSAFVWPLNDGRNHQCSDSYSMCVTNGSYLALVSRIDQTTMSYHVYSLVTGEYILKESFYCSDNIAALTIDTFNHCTWVVFGGGGQTMEVRRFYFPGSYDPEMIDFFVPTSTTVPKGKYKRFAYQLSKLAAHFIGSQVIPSSFICPGSAVLQNVIRETIRLCDVNARKFKKGNLCVIQFYCVLIELNLKMVERASHENKALYGILKDLITKLPMNLGHFIFFSHVDYFYRIAPDETLDTIVTLMTTAPSWTVASYSLKQLEGCTCLAKVKVNEHNRISALIPQDAKSVTEIPALLLSVLLIHQRAIITSVVEELKAHPYTETTIVTKRESGNALDLFMTYAEWMVNKLDSVMTICTTQGNIDQFINSIVFVLFDNLVRLMCPLCECDQVSQLMTALMAVMLPKVCQFLEKYPDYDRLQSSFKLFLFLFSSFAAHLVKGGGLTELEQKFSWVIKSNLNRMNDDGFLDSLSSTTEEAVADPGLSEFLRGGDETMDRLYRAYKAQFNRNLSPEIREIDKLSTLALARNLNCIDEVLHFDGKVTPAIKSVLDQMMRVRNEFRQRTQNNNRGADKIKLMCMILLRLNTGNATAKSVADFILSRFHPDLVAATFKRQRSRIPLTMIGISLLNNIFTKVKYTPFRDIMAWRLSQVTGFEGLASIIEISGLSEDKRTKINSFFELIIRLYNETDNNHFVLIAHKFFKFLGNVAEVRHMFLNFVRESQGNDHKNSPTIFALIYSILSSCDENIIEKLENTKEWMLLSHQLTRTNCTPELFEKIAGSITTEMRDSKWICYSFYNAMKSSALSDDVVATSLDAIRSLLQDCLITGGAYEVVADLIWILRKAVIENHPRQQLVRKMFIEECPSVTTMLAVLGLSTEPVRPYCNVKIQEQLSISSYFAVPSGVEGELKLLPLPFEMNNEGKSMRVDSPNMYAYPILELTDREITDFKCLTKLFGTKFDNEVDRSLFYQAVARFSGCEAFIDQLTPDMIRELAGRIQSFAYTHRSISSLFRASKTFCVIDPSQVKTRDLPFFVIKRGEMCTYLSHFLKDKASIVAKIQSTGYIGLMSAAIERTCVRYSLIQCPSGALFPSVMEAEPIPLGDVKVEVDLGKRKLIVNGKRLPFPNGSMFRLVIGIPASDEFDVRIIDYGFDEYQEYKPNVLVSDGTRYLMSDIPEGQTSLPEDYRDLPDLVVKWRKLSPQERLENYYIPPPVALHLADGKTESSEGLIDSMKSFLHDRIGRQHATIALMRIAANHPKKVSCAGCDLLSLLIESLECFNWNSFINKRFFFNLESPAWSLDCRLNCLYMGLECEARVALTQLVNEPITGFQMMARIAKMCSDARVHYCAVPNRAVSFYPAKVAEERQITIDKRGLVSRCDPLVERSDFQFVIPPDACFTIPQHTNRPDYIFLNINPADNSYISDTIIELLLLIKNFAHLANTVEQKNCIKSALIEIFASGSPLGSVFVPEFIDMIQATIPTTPAEGSPSYIGKLALLGKSLISTNEAMVRFYHCERRMLGSPEFREVCLYFPEFFSLKLPKPGATRPAVPEVTLDPGSIESGFEDIISAVRLLFRQYQSIVGFPFWEVLPYWVKIANIDISRTVRQPSMAQLNFTVPSIQSVDNIKVLSNTSLTTVTVSIKAKPSCSQDALLMYATDENFENVTALQYELWSENLVINVPVMYFALVDATWNDVELNVVDYQACAQDRIYRNSPQLNANLSFDPSSFHNEFVEDMKQFAVDWTEDDTDQLLASIPVTTFMSDSFEEVRTLALSSPLTNNFSDNVVLLRALFLHQCTYLRLNEREKVREALWDATKHLIHFEEAIDAIRNNIQCGGSSKASVSVNRFGARKIVADGFGDPEQSIISQVAREYASHSDAFRVSGNQPWSVKFLNEKAVDAGGPCRELFTEVSSSIFEKTSQLCVRCGELYVPYAAPGSHMKEYRFIGAFIGMILRSGYMQNLPFAPLVWKYLAFQPLTVQDVIHSDRDLKQFITDVRSGTTEVRWMFKQWDGKCVALPGHDTMQPVHPSQYEVYIYEMLQCRLDAIETILEEMRKGFAENTGFTETSQFLTGSSLSYAAQGSPQITLEDLKQMVVWRVYATTEPIVASFWEAVERFTPQERILLFKFITSLTRKPMGTIQLTINPLIVGNPDSCLPTASTCFNQLHLPRYTSTRILYDKLRYAITNCETMELV